jgi:DNA-binding transcriptional LysR family regulator
MLRIGYLFGASRKFLPYACQVFAKENPHTELELYSLEHPAIKESLETNALDMGISMQFQDITPSLYETHRIYSDSLVLVVPENHRLSRKSRVMIDELREETIATVNIGNTKSGSASEGLFATLLHEAGVPFVIAERLNDRDSLPFIMQKDSCLGLMFSHMKGYYGPFFKFIPIEGLDLRFDICAFWKKSKQKRAITEFVTCIDQVMDMLANLDETGDRLSSAWA